MYCRIWIQREGSLQDSTCLGQCRVCTFLENVYPTVTIFDVFEDKWIACNSIDSLNGQNHRIQNPGNLIILINEMQCIRNYSQYRPTLTSKTEDAKRELLTDRDEKKQKKEVRWQNRRIEKKGMVKGDQKSNLGGISKVEETKSRQQKKRGREKVPLWSPKWTTELPTHPPPNRPWAREITFVIARPIEGHFWTRFSPWPVSRRTW